MEKLSEIIQSQCNYKGFYKRKNKGGGGRRDRKGDVTIEAEFRMMWDHESRNVEQLCTHLARKGKKTRFSLKVSGRISHK